MGVGHAGTPCVRVAGGRGSGRCARGVRRHRARSADRQRDAPGRGAAVGRPGQGDAARASRPERDDQAELRLPAPRQGRVGPADRAAHVGEPRPALRALRPAGEAAAGAGVMAHRPGPAGHPRRRRPDGDRRPGHDRPGGEGAARHDQRLPASGGHDGRDQGRSLQLLREHDRPHGAGPLRPADRLGPQQRRPLLHECAVERQPARERAAGHAEDQGRDGRRRRARERLLPRRRALALRRHRPRLRRHRPDPRLHALGRG